MPLTINLRTVSQENLVLEGELRDDTRPYPKGSWLRFPVGDQPALLAGVFGATVYVKTGHLGFSELRQ